MRHPTGDSSEPAAERLPGDHSLDTLALRLAAARADYAAEPGPQTGAALMTANERYARTYLRELFDEVVIGEIATDALPFVCDQAALRIKETEALVGGAVDTAREAEIEDEAHGAMVRFADALASVIDLENWEERDVAPAELTAIRAVITQFLEDEIAAEQRMLFGLPESA